MLKHICSNVSGSQVFQGSTARLIAPVVLTCLIAVGLILVGLYQISMQVEAEGIAIKRLFHVSDRADSLVAVAGDAIDAPGPIVISEGELRQAVDNLVQATTEAQSAILGLNDGAALLQAIDDLGKLALPRKHATGLGEPGGIIDTPVVAYPYVYVLPEIRVLAASVSETARDMAISHSARQDRNAFNTAWQLVSLGCFVLCLACAMAWRRAAQLQRQVQMLPDHLDEMVLGDAPDLTSSGEIGDLVGDTGSRLQDFAQRIRARLRENEKIERMAFADPLTGLPNRRGLLAFLDHLAESDDVWEGDNKIGLIHIDLDHFKTINDTLGHDAGDTVLRESTKRMSTAIRDSDLLARLGGDEFLVVATAIECEADLTRIADRLIEQFETPILYYRRVCMVGISMGLVLGGQRGRVRDPKRLLINADMALFKSKSEGRGRYSVFNSAMAEEVRLRNQRSIALGDALHVDAFQPWFQPMIDRETGRITGLELLARWHDPERGVLMPHEFLEDAEASSLMEEIGLQVLSQALKVIRQWRLGGLSVPVVHLNLGRTQLLSSSLVDRFSWTLDEANIATGQFAIEIDEKDCSSRGGEVAFENVRRLHQMGLQIVLDDFGAEQASLAILGGLNAKMVKCTPRTVRSLAGRRGDKVLVDVLSALNGAANTMGIQISAKGVETELESDFFFQSGISVQQGDFLAPVLDAEQTGVFMLEASKSAVKPQRNVS